MFSAAIGTLIGALGAFILFFYSFKKGFFENLEEVKYQVFKDEEE